MGDISNLSNNPTPINPQHPTSVSMEDVEEEISAGDRTCDLIGDGSQPYALPTMKLKHDRFKRIDAATLVKLIDGEFKGSVESFTIVDCRYPYEYQGGHILNSVNIHTGPDLIKLFIDQRSQHPHHQSAETKQQSLIPRFYSQQAFEQNDENSLPSIASSSSPSPLPHSQPFISSTSTFSPSFEDSQQAINHLHSSTSSNSPNSSSSTLARHIIVFHCEFSSERGPRLMRLLREKDRQVNKYPELTHPELYLLHGGYRDFFKRFKQYCVPQAYRPMNCRSHRDELKSYRKRRKVVTQPRRKENRTPDISFEG